MKRYKIEVEYIGSSYSGWQKQTGDNQKDVRTVQGDLEKALFNFSGEEVVITGCGRTDSGVHGIAMPASFNLEKQDVDCGKIVMAMNAKLKELNADVRVLNCVEVATGDLEDGGFDARFSCVRRHYLYKILNRKAPACLDKDRAWWVYEDLNVRLMNSVAGLLIGKQDFSSFRAAGCQARSPIRTLEHIEVRRNRENKDIIEIYVYAPSFLYHQVRNIVGALVDVGKGKVNRAEFRRILEAKDRTKASATAPAQGLYFFKADYS